MRKVTTTIVCFLACAAMAISVPLSAAACQVDEFYLTKEGVLAASTPELLGNAIKYHADGSKDKLEELVKNGSVVRLAADSKVRVLERSFEFKTLKIQLPDKTDTYWVSDGSLKPIECK